MKITEETNNNSTVSSCGRNQATGSKRQEPSYRAEASDLRLLLVHDESGEKVVVVWHEIAEPTYKRYGAERPLDFDAVESLRILYASRDAGENGYIWGQGAERPLDFDAVESPGPATQLRPVVGGGGCQTRGDFGEDRIPAARLFDRMLSPVLYNMLSDKSQ